MMKILKPKEVSEQKTVRLEQDYFIRQATELAPDLLGKYLCRKTEKGILRYRITETECYYGEADTACHAHKGKTPRTAVMYEAGGRAYIYLCYGIHYLFNIVSGSAGHPEAVLIRGVEGAAGPGRVTRLLRIGKELNAEDLSASDCLWLEDDGARPAYQTAGRVGIGYAAPADREKLWRFTVV